MPISDFLANKWDEKLHNWLLWLKVGGGSAGGGDVRISSVYRPELSQRGYREGGHAVLSGDAMDTDRLMVKVQEDPGPRIYRALVEWTLNDGTRGAQAARLSVHQDTYRDWVDIGKRKLENLSRQKQTREIKSPRLPPEIVYD